MTCKECIHDGVCHLQEMLTGLELEKYIRELGCEDYISNTDFVQVKHGEWEKFEIPHMMRCSECGVSDLDIHRTKFAFCPYCGAKMDGGNHV